MYTHVHSREPPKQLQKNSKHFVFVYILRNISSFKDEHDAFLFFLLLYIVNVNKLNTFNIK